MGPLIGSRRLLLGMGAWINRLVGLFEIVDRDRERLIRRASPAYVGKAAIVSDAVHERPLRAVAAKLSQGLPDCQGYFLYEFFPDAGYRLIAERQPRDCRPVFSENVSELCFQSLAVFAHDCGLASESICEWLGIVHSDSQDKGKAYEDLVMAQFESSPWRHPSRSTIFRKIPRSAWAFLR
jgi:hypothetical protein